MKEFNFNHDSLLVNSLKSGTNDFKIKISKKFYYLRIEKNVINSFVTLYKYDKRKRIYNGNIIGFLSVNNDTTLNRKFLENIDKIQKAQNFLENFKSYLK